MEDEDTSPAKPTDEDIHDAVDGDDENNDEEDAFVYLQSSSIVSILVIVIISLVCLLTISLLIKTVLHSRGISKTLSSYFGYTPNQTIDESILTFWEPKSMHDEQPIGTTTTIINSSSSRPPSTVLTNQQKKAHQIFQTIILPILLLSSILCCILAFCTRLHHHIYPTWGARPKRPKNYVTFELKQPRTKDPV